MACMLGLAAWRDELRVGNTDQAGNEKTPCRLVGCPLQRILLALRRHQLHRPKTNRLLKRICW